MRYDEVRELGEKNEKEIQSAIENRLLTLSPSGYCNRNPYRGNGQYETEYDERNEWYDIELVINLKDYHTNYGTTITWFNGKQVRWIECKLDRVGADTGRIPVEMYSDFFNKGVFSPSGILATKSDLWITRRLTGEYFVCHTSQLRLLAYGNLCEKKRTEMLETSKVPSLINLVSDRLVKEIAIDYGMDINNINLEKILYGENLHNHLKTYQ